MTHQGLLKYVRTINLSDINNNVELSLLNHIKLLILKGHRHNPHTEYMDLTPEVRWALPAMIIENKSLVTYNVIIFIFGVEASSRLTFLIQVILF